MFGFKGSSGFQGHAYIILQVIRFCNVAVLVAVMIASVLMLIFAKLPNGFQFFADIVHALVFLFAGLLIYTEIGIWQKGQNLVASAWPMLGPNRGFTGLGAIMVLIGCHLLGGLSSSTYTSDQVPPQISQVILGVGVITLAFGFTNIIASIAFRNENVRAREVRETGAITQYVNFNDNYSSRSNSTRKPEISGPMPLLHEEQREQSTVDYFSDDKSAASIGDRHSPIIPGIARPPTALHPAHRASRYSEASHLDRFGHSMV
ncbi:hypothetical protein F5Y19DRAFT_201067 [Xylariaceae sp. FL1651]|nr:hypothetical protein F5Y19DRAFT_201067 [Xylariaceae sp. FL1651]